jgi:hypothetical protein
MKRFSKTLILGGMILLLFSGPAFADLIDFRTDAPFPADDPSGDTSYSATIGSLTLTFTPLGTGTPVLFWDPDDGFGVDEGGGYEYDEIENPEALQISFSSPIYVNYFGLTDLYYEDGYEERGSWSLDNTNWNSFSQTDHTQLPSPTSNGEYILGINSIVSDIWFTAPGLTGLFCKQDHEFSVAKVDVVPEPATMLLLGSGLAGLAGLRKRFRSRL